MATTQLAFSLLLAGACVAPDELSTVEQGAHPCPPAVCGFNSPEIDHNGFHELAKDGRENSEGFAITGFVKAGESYRLEVSNGELSGTRRGSPRLEHGGLVGAEIHVSYRRFHSFAIRVTAVGRMPFFAPPAGWIETYVLEYGRIEYGEGPTSWTNVCDGRWAPPWELSTGPYGDGNGQGNAETYGQHPLESILFDQDRFDMERKTVGARADTGWFNIGCAGHTLSKLYLTRATIASGIAAWEERQAALKMLTADYCGDGTAFTVAGQRLDWKNGRLDYFGPPLALEARWTESGATCLDTPRMTQPTTSQGQYAFPDIEKAIASQCARPPRCAERDPHAMDGALFVSALR
jgi:hypothetical protein